MTRLNVAASDDDDDDDDDEQKCCICVHEVPSNRASGVPRATRNIL